MFTCDRAKVVWRSIGIWDKITEGWYLWWERRQVVHGENIQRAPRSGLSIVALTKSYKLATTKSTKVRQGWQKPLDGSGKVNIDASFDERTGCGSIRVTIRAWTGGAIAASHGFIPYLVDAPMAEAYALKEGLQLAQHAGCNRLIVHSYCMEVSRQIQLPLCMMNVILVGTDFRRSWSSIIAGKQTR